MSIKTIISKIADVVMGQSPKGEDVNSSDDGFPLLNGPTEFADRYPNPVQYTNSGKKFSKPDDILFCVRGSTTGRMNYSDQKYAIGRGIAGYSWKKWIQNTFYHDYNIIVAAGNAAGMGVEALPPVLNAMGNPLESKTITLSCGKLTTGVSVKPWSGIFMLRNSSSPETYFQAAFRVQTPWAIKNPDSKSPNKTEIIKEECYVLDFAPNRALRQIADYSCRLDVGESNPEKKVAEFISFLPVLAYDGSSMKQIDAAAYWTWL